MTYKVLMTEEALDDIYDFSKYMHKKLGNPSAAENFKRNIEKEIRKLGHFPMEYGGTGIYHRGYGIHKKVYKLYLLFYIVDQDAQEVYILRVLKDIMDWQYHIKTMKKKSKQPKRNELVAF